MITTHRMSLASFVLVAALVLAAILAATRSASAQTGGAYELTWRTVDAGGGTSTGGSYSLSGTAGQPDAGTHSGGAYTETGGFWAGLAQALHRLFVPYLRR